MSLWLCCGGAGSAPVGMLGIGGAMSDYRGVVLGCRSAISCRAPRVGNAFVTVYRAIHRFSGVPDKRILGLNDSVKIEMSVRSVDAILTAGTDPVGPARSPLDGWGIARRGGALYESKVDDATTWPTRLAVAGG